MRNTARLISVHLFLCLAACASQEPPSVVSDFDDLTGVSLARPREPVRMLAPRPGLSLVGKDYLFTGPVSVSTAGTPHTFLWFALGSTIDRPHTGARLPTFKTIVVRVDDSLMTFDLIPWSSASKSDPYELPVAVHASYAAKITNSQIRQLAQASRLAAYVTDEDDRSPLYELVDGELADWLAFCCGENLSAVSQR